jgi:uncharacterized membrane protein HdeD (DUF308 family)
MTLLRHVLSILLLPATVTLVVPYVILSSRPFPSSSLVAMFFGALVILCGLALVALTLSSVAERNLQIPP